MAEQLKEVEIPFGAKDSGLCGWEYTIPEGMEATIVDNKIVVKKKESEDEKIRKELISFLQSYDTLLTRKIVAWLEKQGEQKVEVKYVYTKFRIGDVIVEIKSNGYCQPVTVKYIGEGAYSCESDDGKRSLSFPIINQDEYKLVEQKPTDKVEQNPAWSEEDEISYNYALAACLYYGEAKGYTDTETHQKTIDWFKAIKERIGG